MKKVRPRCGHWPTLGSRTAKEQNGTMPLRVGGRAATRSCNGGSTLGPVAQASS